MDIISFKVNYKLFLLAFDLSFGHFAFGFRGILGETTHKYLDISIKADDKECFKNFSGQIFKITGFF